MDGCGCFQGLGFPQLRLSLSPPFRFPTSGPLRTPSSPVPPPDVFIESPALRRSPDLHFVHWAHRTRSRPVGTCRLVLSVPASSSASPCSDSSVQPGCHSPPGLGSRVGLCCLTFVASPFTSFRPGRLLSAFDVSCAPSDGQIVGPDHLVRDFPDANWVSVTG